MKSLQDNGTFDVVPLPRDQKVITGKWVYAVKSDPSGNERFKARYVARGFTQTYGEDYHDTFSPTARITSMRILVQCAVQDEMFLQQKDLHTAYLNAVVD